MIQAINGGKHKKNDENVEYLKNQEVVDRNVRKNAQPFRINLDGEYGEIPAELEVFHNHWNSCEYWLGNQQRWPFIRSKNKNK